MNVLNRLREIRLRDYQKFDKDVQGANQSVNQWMRMQDVTEEQWAARLAKRDSETHVRVQQARVAAEIEHKVCLFALKCLPSTVCPQLSALNCLPSTVCPQLTRTLGTRR